MSEDSEQRAIRLGKLQALQAAGHDPFRIERYRRTHTTSAAVAGFADLEGTPVQIAGRISSFRAMGKACFADLTDESGRIQLYVRRDEIGDESYSAFRDLDIGDIVGVEGLVFKTRTGEISVHVSGYSLLAKCLRPVPIGKEFEGRRHDALADVEMRHRMRYLDLIANRDSVELLYKRSRMVDAIRRFLAERGFVEVETPVLQAIAGGAAARPFTTHHNALGADFKLRISLELPLKRLIVGGIPRVFEIGRVFRNEGISPRHNPEFTLLELYEAYSDLDDIMDLVEDMYVAACVAVNGSPVFRFTPQSSGSPGDSIEVDVSGRPWRRLRLLDGIEQETGIARDELRDLPAAVRACERVGVPVEKEHSVGGIIEKLHERFVQPTLIEPTFMTDFPAETSPLAKLHPDDPSVVRRFEVYMCGQELGNAFSEINDPLDQRRRFEQQTVQRAAGDDEAHPMDEDFLRALEFGMPPTGGLGIGIDRLAMVLSNAPSIREVIAFPLLRPER